MIPLNQIQVPEPCGKDWDAMDGDARRRFCAGCGCHVHDLSAMTAGEAQSLLDRAPGRLCVRFETRPDGTVRTQEEEAMPRGRDGRRTRRFAAAASWALALAVGGLGLTARAQTPRGALHAARPKAQAAGKGHVLLGKVVARRPHAGSMTTMGAPLPATPTTMGKPAPPPVSYRTMGIVAPPRPPRK